MPSTMDFRFLSVNVSIKRRRLSIRKSAPNAPPTSTIGHRTASSGTTHATEIGRNVASEYPYSDTSAVGLVGEPQYRSAMYHCVQTLCK